MANTRCQLFVPNTLVDWPWPRVLTPHYAEAKAESAAWVASFHPFEPKEQREFDLCDLSLLACLTYSTGSKESVRVGCDLMNFSFVYDEYTDVEDPEGAQSLADIAMDAFRNTTAKPRPSGESIIGEMARQLGQRVIALEKPGAPCIQHFIDYMGDYMTSVVRETEDRTINRVRKVEDYLALRRDTVATAPTFAIIEFGLDLPDDVLHHATLRTLTRGATELVALINDIHSYVLELARGFEFHNVITVVIHEHGLDLAEAMVWVENFTKDVAAQFLHVREQVPSWGEKIDKKVQRYIDGLGYWVRGNDEWCFETSRYYGDEAQEVKKTRMANIPEGPLKEGYVKRLCPSRN